MYHNVKLPHIIIKTYMRKVCYLIISGAVAEWITSYNKWHKNHHKKQNKKPCVREGQEEGREKSYYIKRKNKKYKTLWRAVKEVAHQLVVPFVKAEHQWRANHDNDIHTSPHSNCNRGISSVFLSIQVYCLLICLSFKIINMFFLVLKSIEHFRKQKFPMSSSLTTTVSIHYIMAYFKLSFI